MYSWLFQSEVKQLLESSTQELPSHMAAIGHILRTCPNLLEKECRESLTYFVFEELLGTDMSVADLSVSLDIH